MISVSNNISGSRLKCPIDKSQYGIFFTLVDYRNNYFTSNDPERIIEFYDGFENRDQLIQWMKERPKGASEIHEVDGDKDIIVVIPTADFNGKYARECRDNIFKGMHMVFVESGVGNYYFNYAHNCNVGIRKAMEYDPKWVVVSNDDMIKVDDAANLAILLSKIDENDITVTLAAPDNYHTKAEIVGKTNFLASIFYNRNNKTRRIWKIKRGFGIVISAATDSFIARLFFGKHLKIIDIVDFAIFSSCFIKSNDGNLFDEIFINHFEDSELSLRIQFENRKTFISSYKIKSVRGGTISEGYIRDLRTIPSLAYLTEKYRGKF